MRKDSDYRYSLVTQQWQRRWGGERIKHGWCRKYDGKGRLALEEEYRAGQLHGVHRQYTDGINVCAEGRYERGSREGMWVYRQFKDWERRESFHGGLREGESVLFAGGQRRRLIFRNDELVAIDGEPIDRTLREQLARGTNGERLRDALSATTYMNFVETPLVDVAVFWEDMEGLPVAVDPSIADAFPVTEWWQSISLSDALAIACQPRGLVAVQRYGGIFITTPQAAAIWIDPTSVGQIRPPPDSWLAAVWNEPVDIHAGWRPIAEVIQELAQPLEVTIDTTPVEMKLDNVDGYSSLTEVMNHPFCHALGYLLYRTHCRCKLEGETLVILPPEEEAEGEVGPGQ